MIPSLSSLDLDTYDRCERRYAFEREWVPKSISPLGLLYRSLEGSLSEPVPEDSAKSLALKISSKMELQTTSLEPYAVTTHVGFLAGIIATFIHSKIGVLMPSPVTTTKQYEWTPRTFEDSCGLRHRFVLVDHWDDDRLSAEAHSWLTIGELAATDRPLTLHAIVIGSHRGGRRHSPWAKGYFHPQNGSLRFAKRKGGREGKNAGLVGGWNEVWREKSVQYSTQAWMQQMQEDGVLEDLVITRPIKLDVSDRRLLAAKSDLVQIQGLMKKATSCMPMRRSSCDETGRGPCPHQMICYSPIPMTHAELPRLFDRKVQGSSSSASEGS
jgi:hypothetical protein